ncbi:MAG: hypothetical protein OIF57_15345 [Marinobacterium sp.]|nr:hypothetical protein [Marinobacterium sp.]
MSSNKFEWDGERISKLSERCTHIMLGLMGLALMLMMMDLASVYLLAPAALILLITRQAQSYYNSLEESFRDASLELAPRTLFLNQPATSESTRLRYQDIVRVEVFRKWTVNGLRLQTQQGQTLELAGFPDTLSHALLEAQQKTTQA